ncbi:carbon monoxide dehydrogenase subunit G [Pelagibacteraceae bacterium]|nr:carbon monoxide dehydrogenase subunit G [Pelagibacteraceae bacterium]
MKLTGSYKLNVKKEIVWDALNNPEILKQCIPGCDSFEKENDSTFNASATNQIGPMNATFSGAVKLSNIKKNQSYTLSGEGQSSVGFANGSANVMLEEKNGITILNYEVDVNVGGKIAQLGSRLIDGVAKKMSDYFFGRFADIVSPVIAKDEGGDKTSESKKVRVKELKSNFLNKYIYSAIIILILLLVVIFYFVSR